MLREQVAELTAQLTGAEARLRDQAPECEPQQQLGEQRELSGGKSGPSSCDAEAATASTAPGPGNGCSVQALCLAGRCRRGWQHSSVTPTPTPLPQEAELLRVLTMPSFC